MCLDGWAGLQVSYRLTYPFSSGMILDRLCSTLLFPSPLFVSKPLTCVICTLFFVFKLSGAERGGAGRSGDFGCGLKPEGGASNRSYRV